MTNVPSDFRPGDRVTSHPATDRWMRGIRWGTVIKVTRTRVHVTFDVGGTVAMLAGNLLHDPN